jgi:cholesterol oxidase
MPLLLSAIVDSTIQRSARAALERSWLAKRFPEAVRRWIAARLRQGAHALFGNGQQIAEQALRSILDAGGLPRREVARRVLGYDDTGASHRAVLLGMGRDAVAGQLHYDRHSDELRAELDLSRLAPGYTRQERLMSDIARELGGELRTNPAWAFVGKPVTVHNQGGCRMSDDPSSGVTDANGQVYGCEGLYVLDGSVLPAPVGVNPSATILAIAERNIEVFLRNHPRSAWSDPASEPARAHNILRADASRWVERATGWHFAPPEPAHGSPDFRAQPLGLRFQEWLHGYFSPTNAGDPIPRDDADYRAAEARGRPGHGGSNDAVGFPIDLALTNTIDDLNVYYEDTRHTIRVAGKVAIVLPGRATPSDLGVNGQLCLFVPRPERLQPISAARRRDRFLRYELILASDERGIWLLRGKKRLRADAALEAWLDLSTVLVRLFGPFAEPPDLSARDELQRCCRRRHLAGIGAVHLDMTRFLHQQLPSFEVFPADDPARTSWAISKFAAFFFGELQRIYMPELFTTLGASFRAAPSSIRAGNMR